MVNLPRNCTDWFTTTGLLRYIAWYTKTLHTVLYTELYTVFYTGLYTVLYTGLYTELYTVLYNVLYTVL